MRHVMQFLCTALAVAVVPVHGFAFSASSADILPADGTSGQSLTTGYGIKTGHIQDGAITTAKVLDGAVTSTKIAVGAVGTAQLGSGVVTAANLADGAVTEAKIAGLISSSKIDGLDAALASKANNPTRVVTVADDGTGDFPDPALAAASIVDATQATPYVIKVLPGVYTVTSPVMLQPFVDLEGSGQGVTRIIMAGTGWSGAVRAAPNSEIRDITIEATEARCAIGHPESFSADPVVLSRVSALASRTTNDNGVCAAVCAAGAPYLLEHVTLSSSGPYGYALSTTNAPSVTIRASDLYASTTSVLAVGIWDSDGDRLDIDSSRITAEGPETRGIVMLGAPSGGRSSTSMRNTAVNARTFGLLLQRTDAWVENSVVVAPALSIHAAEGADVRIVNTRVDGPLLNYDPPVTNIRCLGAYTSALGSVACQ